MMHYTNIIDLFLTQNYVSVLWTFYTGTPNSEIINSLDLSYSKISNMSSIFFRSTEHICTLPNSFSRSFRQFMDLERFSDSFPISFYLQSGLFRIRLEKLEHTSAIAAGIRWHFHIFRHSCGKVSIKFKSIVFLYIELTYQDQDFPWPHSHHHNMLCYHTV